jgi:uncharacterized protein
MNSYTPDNAAVWFEIPVLDMACAKSFYTNVVQASFQDDDTGPNPMAIFSIKDMKSGVSGHLYPGDPAGNGAGSTIHLAVPKPLEDTLKRVAENGGKVVSEIVTIPPGRFAYCTDPDGNSISFFTRS